jgi:hypothetical protein
VFGQWQDVAMCYKKEKNTGHALKKESSPQQTNP